MDRQQALGGRMMKHFTVEEVQKLFLSSQQNVFDAILSKDPKWAAELQPHFEEFMLAVQEGGPKATIFDIRRRIPRNKWFPLLDYQYKVLTEKTRS